MDALYFEWMRRLQMVLGQHTATGGVLHQRRATLTAARQHTHELPVARFAPGVQFQLAPGSVLRQGILPAPLIIFSTFVGYLALISISRGVLNLLPVPLLDGGHLLYYLVEIFKGSPVSDRVLEVGQRIGMAVLAMLMALALFNDLSRLL